MATIISRIIPPNESRFVKGRIIGGNILSAQEMIHDIKKINRGGNVVIKLDMKKKAYDRLSCV